GHRAGKAPGSEVRPSSRHEAATDACAHRHIKKTREIASISEERLRLGCRPNICLQNNRCNRPKLRANRLIKPLNAVGAGQFTFSRHQFAYPNSDRTDTPLPTRQFASQTYDILQNYTSSACRVRGNGSPRQANSLWKQSESRGDFRSANVDAD